MLMSAVFAQSDKDPLVLMGDAQAIIKDINSVFSEPMTAKEAFERVEGSGTIFLNKMRIELYETLKISDLANFNIIGNGATLVAKIDMPIIIFRDVMNVSIHGLKVVHEIGANCSQNCIEFYNSSNIRIDKCDFDGSGFIGLALNKTVSATIKNNRFYNCTFGIAAWNSRLITVKDNSFSENRNQDIMTNDLSQYNNDWKAENIFGALVDYSAIKGFSSNKKTNIEVGKEPIVYNEYTFEITDLSNSGKFSSAYYTLWIDWNKDGNFSPEWGDWDKSVVLQERKDDFEGEKWKIVETMEIVESPKFSIVVYKNGEVFQNIKTPFDMEIDIPFASRFFTVEDVNFDGYEDFYFTDYMGMVNISFIIYLYNSTSEKFEINEDYRSITSPRFDIDHQIIKSFTRGNAAYHESEIYIVLNDKLTRISKIIDDVRSNEYEYIIYDGEKEVAVNESLSKVKLNIAFFKTQKFNVIIDLLDNSNYRYASWSASKNLRNTPDLILKNGVKQETENEISYKFKKGEFSYVCIFNKLTSDGQLKVFQNKKELVKQEASVFIVPNEVKPYEGNKHKITLDIKNNLKD